jgi:acyl-CoA synthetase (AMP-forming)/AMP-acid ligase II
MLSCRPEDRLIAVLPFFHTYGLGLLMGWTLWCGATLVSMPRFDLEEFLRVLQEQRITRALLVPPILRALATHPLVASYDLSALELIGSGAAPLDLELERACAERIGCPVVQGYGLTETTTSVFSTAGAPLGPRDGSVGVLLPDTQARLIDPANGQDLGTGEPGELWVRGPQVMRGYLNADLATADVLDSDGWLRTGDLCRVDADGYLFVVDRIKELIKYKGYQIAPAELEAVLLAHPRVADVAVVRRAGRWTPRPSWRGSPSGWRRTSGSGELSSWTRSPRDRTARSYAISCSRGTGPGPSELRLFSNYLSPRQTRVEVRVDGQHLHVALWACRPRLCQELLLTSTQSPDGGWDCWANSSLPDSRSSKIRSVF